MSVTDYFKFMSPITNPEFSSYILLQHISVISYSAEPHIQGASKVLGLTKNEITFTPGNRFKPIFQHY